MSRRITHTCVLLRYIATLGKQGEKMLGRKRVNEQDATWIRKCIRVQEWEYINMEDRWKNYRENNFLRSSILVASTSQSLKLLHDRFHRCSCCGLRGAVSSSLISFLIGTIKFLVAQTDSSYARNSKRTETDQRVTSLAIPNYPRRKPSPMSWNYYF